MTHSICISQLHRATTERIQYLAKHFFPAPHGCFAASAEWSGATPLNCASVASNTMTRFGNWPFNSGCFTQNSTKNDLRRSEIKNFPGRTCPHMPHTPSARASHTSYNQSHAHWNPTPLFKILDPPVGGDQCQNVELFVGRWICILLLIMGDNFSHFAYEYVYTN